MCEALINANADDNSDTLLIDTGSSNTWVRGKKYVKTSTSKNTGGSVVRISGSEFIYFR